MCVEACGNGNGNMVVVVVVGLYEDRVAQEKTTTTKKHREHLCRYADSEPQPSPKVMPDCLMHEFRTACRLRFVQKAYLMHFYKASVSVK